MTVLVLAGFAAALASGVPRLVTGVAWVYREPRLGLAAWQASSAATVLAALLAGVAAVMHWGSGHRAVVAFGRFCLNALIGSHGRAGQAVAVSGLVLLVVVTVRLAGAWRQVVTWGARQRQAHWAMLGLASPRPPDSRPADLAVADPGLAVLPHPVPVAYVLPGPQPRVVVSTATLDRLSGPELAAVLAHERAHVAGRHHWLVGVSQLLRRAFPRVPLFAHAARETSRLLEMCADDAAARRHPRLTLARALAAMAGPPPGGAGTEALRSTGGDAVERLRRLLDPPRPLPVPTRVAICSGLALLPLLPIAIIVAGQLAPVPLPGL